MDEAVKTTEPVEPVTKKTGFVSALIIGAVIGSGGVVGVDQLDGGKEIMYAPEAVQVSVQDELVPETKFVAVRDSVKGKDTLKIIDTLVTPEHTARPVYRNRTEGVGVGDSYALYEEFNGKIQGVWKYDPTQIPEGKRVTILTKARIIVSDPVVEKPVDGGVAVEPILE